MKTEIRISPLFFAVVSALLIFDRENTVLIALFSSIFHECGHLLTSLYFGSCIKQITLSFYGMKIIRQSELSLSLKKEIAVSLSGVTVNFFICIVFLIIYLFSPHFIFMKISAVNLLLGLFNFLPVFSLDGGRALTYILLLRFPYEKSEKILKTVSFAVLIPIIILGVFLAFKNRNFTLLICSIYLALGSI